MRTSPFTLIVTLALVAAGRGADSTSGQAKRVVLDEVGVQNLRIQTSVAATGDFEETVFTLGRIEAKPGNIAAVTSKISGQVVGLPALPGDRVLQQAEVLKVESRQPGNPSTVISLRAPLTGVVTQLGVRLGDPVEPDRALLEITNLSEVLAVARVPEHMAGRIKVGTTAHITLSALGPQNFTGTVARFGTAADAASGTVDAIFVLPNEAGAILPGMRAEFSIVIERRAGVVSVPRSALQGDPGGRFLYVKDSSLPNAFVKTPVVVGKTNGSFVEVVQGLKPTDEVVIQGAYSLAFAGAGSLSLKAALDVAHGHAHNADGSELTRGAKNSRAAAKVGDAPAHEKDHDHDHAEEHEHEPSGQGPFWKIVSGVLFILLLMVGSQKRPVFGRLAPTEPPAGRAGS